MHLQAIITISLLLFAQIDKDRISQRFASDWERAVECVTEHHSEWESIFKIFEVEASECEAIVFPELIRYSHLKDYMEQGAVRALYVQGGTGKANFSIGLFQMKPSFAEQVELAWMKSPLRHDFQLYFDCSDTPQARSNRVKRLTDNEWQCVYLSIFVRLMFERESRLAAFTAQERVSFLSTAYNFSFKASAEELFSAAKSKSFHLDLIPSKNTVYYSYSEIALEAYKKLSNSR